MLQCFKMVFLKIPNVPKGTDDEEQVTIIVHDCYTLRKPKIAILAIVQFHKIQLLVVEFVYDS